MGNNLTLRKRKDGPALNVGYASVLFLSKAAIV